MAAADMAEFLWDKSLNALKETETELPFQFTLTSHFQGIKQAMENKKYLCLAESSRICNLLYELNDVLIECQIFAQQRKALKKSRIAFNPMIDYWFLHKRKTQLVGIKKQFDKMEGQSGPLRNLPLTFSEGNGFDEYMEKIESMLLKNRSNDSGVEFKFIGICGVGGTGKTTLARKVFNSEKVSSHFSRKIWICLSVLQRKERDIRSKILQLVLEELAGDPILSELKTSNLSEPLGILKELSHLGYLIVCDDVWPWHANVLAEKTLPGGVGDGAVIVTSRLLDVARRMGCKNFINLPSKILKMKDCGKISERILTYGIGDGSSTPGFQQFVQDTERKLCEGGFKIIGICGMGGAGKTTLAREVFNSRRVSKVFSRKIWVCLSGIQRNEIDIGIKIFKLILEELDYDIDELKGDDITMIELSQTLQHLLSNERYLIIFDDVWPWHSNFLAAEISSAGGFPRYNNSAVIVTSRLQRVARKIGGENLIHLQSPLLKLEECWKIFEHTLISGLCNESEIGFEQCLQNIDCILQKDGFNIIGICGVGGARKTTLARKIFDSDVSKKFSKKIWVSLSGIQRNEQDIGTKILKLALDELDYDINESTMDDLTMTELLGTLRLLLSKENYLIVFDDVWPWHSNFLAEETNSSRGLPRGAGGAVIVTSRLEEVARRLGGETLIHLQHPEMEDCGKIFERTLQYDPDTCVRIKNEIMYKFRGLPLAAKTLGEIFLDKIREAENSYQAS